MTEVVDAPLTALFRNVNHKLVEHHNAEEAKILSDALSLMDKLYAQYVLILFMLMPCPMSASLTSASPGTRMAMPRT